MEFELYKMEAEEKMSISLERYESNLSKISTGRANPALLQSIKVDYYGTLTPITQLAVVTVPEPRQLLIKPYDMSINKDIVGVINNSSLGFRAIDEGDKSRITLPEMTTDRRRELVKSLSKYTEQAKIGVRSGRQDANKNIKSDDELSDDEKKSFLEEIQKITDSFILKIDQLTKEKEKDLMTM